MKKKLQRLLACVASISLLLCGCSDSASYYYETALPSTGTENVYHGEEIYNPVVPLTIWGAKEDEELLNTIILSFKAANPNTEFDFDVKYIAESDCKNKLTKDVKNAADVFTFPDDQLQTLVASGIIKEIEEPEEIIKRNSHSSVQAATIDNVMYGYPLTSDNGYFMYYNKKYFKEDDLTSLDKMLKIASQNNKKISMDFSSGWYLYSFYGNTNLTLELNDDGISNYCTWNAKKGDVTGKDVVLSLMDIAGNKGFKSLTDNELIEEIKNDNVIAAVSGIWNSKAIQAEWGDDFGATKLPTFTCNDKQIQMSSYLGYKMVGVNRYSSNYRWAEKFANWMTNEENQTLRYELRGQVPSNIQTSQSDEINSSESAKAFIKQSEFSHRQHVGESYWDPVKTFGEAIISNKIAKKDIQQTLNKLVKDITFSNSH